MNSGGVTHPVSDYSITECLVYPHDLYITSRCYMHYRY